MQIFILVRQLVLLVCINSALIMSPPARTINKTPHKYFAHDCLGVGNMTFFVSDALIRNDKPCKVPLRNTKVETLYKYLV